MTEPNKVIRTPRQVIERKLLTALEDENTVAILASRQDLETLAEACEFFYSPQSVELARSLRQLQREAFPACAKPEKEAK